MTLDQVIAGITPADTAAMERAKARWDSIAKPLGSLGALEEAVIRIAGMTGSADVDISKRAVVVMCADNGVVAQGVTQTGQEVTAIVAENMSTGDTSVCAMARSAGAEVVPVDIGTAVPLTGARIVQRCVRRGTADMTRGPAMSREEAVQAVLTGVETARELCAGGVHLLATGEMGIGNTTTSSAVAAVLLGQEPVVMTGLASLGMVEGVGGGKFAPERTITRAEFTVMAMRFARLPEGGENPFSDVTSSDWFYDQVVGAVQYGWITGYTDGTFRPEATITRAEVTAITNRLLDRAADEDYVDDHAGELRQFPDVSASYWAYHDIVEATNAHSYRVYDGEEHWM